MKEFFYVLPYKNEGLNCLKTGCLHVEQKRIISSDQWPRLALQMVAMDKRYTPMVLCIWKQQPTLSKGNFWQSRPATTFTYTESYRIKILGLFSG